MRTDEKLQAICDRLHSNCGDIHEAARWVGVSPAFVHSWIKDDETAANQIQEAQRVGYGGLESEAVRRAVKGVEEEVYYKGEVVGYKTNYSDGLLGKLLEARVPAYSKKDSGNNFNGPTQINIMPRADSYEEWLGMRDATLRNKALSAPDTALEAEFEDVSDMSALEGLGL